MSPSRSLRRVPVVLASILLVGVAVTLGGCTVVSDTLDDRAELYYPTHSRAIGDWGPDALPAWIPDRATRIHRLTADNGREQMVRLRSDADLPPDCDPTPRTSLPFASRQWMPDVSDLDRVATCGDWEVAPVDDGYVAWLTPASLKS